MKKSWYWDSAPVWISGRFHIWQHKDSDCTLARLGFYTKCPKFLSEGGSKMDYSDFWGKGSMASKQT